jgi:hypothetical protein
MGWFGTLNTVFADSVGTPNSPFDLSAPPNMRFPKGSHTEKGTSMLRQREPFNDKANARSGGIHR